MSKTIPLTQGKVAIVDDADFDWLNQWKWYAIHRRSIWYAETRDRSTGRCIRMHRLITKVQPDLQVDHRNRDGLDNRRCNLRCCTNS